MSKNPPAHKIPVKFRSVTLSGTARIGLSIDADDMRSELAEELLLGAQVQAKLQYVPGSKKDAEGQQVMDAAAVTCSGVGEIASYRRFPDHWSCSLVFPRSSIDPNVLGQLAGEKGEVGLARIGDADTQESKGEGNNDDD